MSIFIPADRLDALARKFGAGPYAQPTPQPAIKSSAVFSVREDGKNFLLSLPSVGEIKLLSTLAVGGAEKTRSEWQEYSRINLEGVVVPSSVVIYQILRGLYHTNDDSVREKCVLSLRQKFYSMFITGTKVVYKTGLEATISHMQLDENNHLVDIEIPEFTRYNNDWSYLMLASEQEESALGRVETIPDNAKPFLEALFGEGYEEAGAVFQYIRLQKNNNLREVRLWTPTATNRNTERALVFGRVGNDGLSVECSVYGSWPALGVIYT